MVAAGADRGPTRPRYRTTGIQQRDAEHIESCLPPPLCDSCNYLPSALLEITRKRISSRMQTHNLPRRARFRHVVGNPYLGITSGLPVIRSRVWRGSTVTSVVSQTDATTRLPTSSWPRDAQTHSSVRVRYWPSPCRSTPSRASRHPFSPTTARLITG
jgi:hypothetical protein